jgi:hypothetical protein
LDAEIATADTTAARERYSPVTLKADEVYEEPAIAWSV